MLGVIPKARRHGLRLLATPDAIVRWHRDIVRRRWAARSLRGKTGRPAIRRNIRALVLRLARENPDYVDPVIMWSLAADQVTLRSGGCQRFT
jgi:putative transposase